MAALRLCLVLSLLALAMVAESSESANWGLTHMSSSGHVGDLVDEDWEKTMDSEVTRRTLAQGGKFISYGALVRNNVPCNKRGASYYNCQQSGRANPYRRGCSAITHCARSNA